MNGKISLTKLIIGFSGILLMVCLFPVKANADTGQYDYQILSFCSSINSNVGYILQDVSGIETDTNNIDLKLLNIQSYVQTIMRDTTNLSVIANALSGTPVSSGIIDYCYTINSQCTTISTLLNQIDADTSNISDKINAIKTAIDNINSNVALIQYSVSLIQQDVSDILDILQKNTDYDVTGYEFVKSGGNFTISNKTFQFGEPIYYNNFESKNNVLVNNLPILPNSSCKYLFYVCADSPINYCSVNTDYGSFLNYKTNKVTSFDYSFYIYTMEFSTNEPLVDIYLELNGVNGFSFIYSYGLLGYVGTAADILNYMESQWNNTSGSVSDLNNQTSSLSSDIGTINTFENNMMSNYDTAYSATGMSSYNISGAGNEMIAVSGLVNTTWNKLPVKLRFYITTVLVVGFIGVVLNVTGRIKNKMERI